MSDEEKDLSLQKGNVYHIKYWHPGMRLVKTEVMDRDTNFVGEMMTSALKKEKIND